MRYIAMLLAAGVVSAVAQEHEHGVNVPDWYDPSCCSQKDCKPIADKDIVFFDDGFGNVGARYLPTNTEFSRDKWRNSQDERYHVCVNTADYGYCVYIRQGV